MGSPLSDRPEVQVRRGTVSVGQHLSPFWKRVRYRVGVGVHEWIGTG